MRVDIEWGKLTVEAFGHVFFASLFRDNREDAEEGPGDELDPVMVRHANHDNPNGQFEFGFFRPLDYPEDRWKDT